MDNPKPTAEVKIGEKTYTMTFDFNAMAIIQEETGRNPFGSDLWNNLGPLEVIDVLYGFLNTQHPEIKKENLRKMIHIGNMKHIITVMQEAWEKAIPEDDGGSGSGEKKMNQDG